MLSSIGQGMACAGCESQTSMESTGYFGSSTADDSCGSFADSMAPQGSYVSFTTKTD
jgi:hypothetical protein